MLPLLNNPIPVPSREARSALTAPSAIAAFTQNSNLIFKRIMRNFAQHKDNSTSSQQPLAMLGIGSVLESLDEHSLGIGFSAGVPLGDILELSVRDCFLKERDNTTR